MNALDVSRMLWDFYLSSTVLLAAVLCVDVLVSQPARRMALAWATVVGLVALMLLTMIPNWSRIALLPPAPPAPTWTAELEPVFGPAIQRTPRIAADSGGEHVTLERETTTVATQMVVIDYGLLASYAFLAGSAAVVGWQWIGAWQGRRLRARAQAVPHEIDSLLTQLSPKVPVELGVLAELPVPVALGLRRPCILLPQTLATTASSEQLRSVLAHELAHIEHRDLWLLALLRSLMVLLWPHPLFWLWRRQVRHDQEILADAAAAELSTRTDYAKQLVALARSAVDARVPRLASSVGLWEKPSQLTQRIKLLLDERFMILRSCSMNWRLGTVLVLGGLAIALSLVTLTPAEVEDVDAFEKPIAGDEPEGAQGNDVDDDFRTMEVRITDEEGQPLDGAKLFIGVWYTKGYQGEKVPKEYFADANGLVNVKLPRRLFILRLWPSKPGYVPEFTNFTEGSHEEGLLIPDRYEFQLAKGTSLGGTIVDENGAPVSGVKVDVSLQVDEPDWGVNPEPMISTWLTDDDFNEGSAITDEKGRWRIDNAPAPGPGEDYEFRLKITHPEFAGDTKYGELQSQQQVTTAALRDEAAKVVLSRGKQVKGVVVDSEGKPVTDGIVVWGNNPYSGDQKQFETRLGSGGSFVTRPLSLGEHAFTVIAPRFSAKQRVVNVESSTPDLRLKLKSGKRLTVKVVDPDGKPIKQAYFHVGSWSSVEEAFTGGQSSILHMRIPRNAGDDGVYRWDGAPADAVTFQISARDFAAKTVSLTATDAEHVVELMPALVVYGKVTDAVTGKPVETFDVVPLLSPDGIGLNQEWKYGTVTGEDGAFEIRLDGISEYQKNFMLRFEAAGYQLALSEKTFNIGDGRVEYDATLTPVATESEKNQGRSTSPQRNAEYEDGVFVPDGGAAQIRR
jgi:beta-lactamase regulating signal transducer with metallopeptidase domain/protocatechuate 3,4-dioxygenase beta subunit